MKNTMLLTTPKQTLKLFAIESDRERLKNPIRVKPLWSCATTRLVWVCERGSGLKYSVDPKNLSQP